MLMAVISGAADLRALLPDMVRHECQLYQQLQQEQGQGQQEEEGQQEPAAVLAAVLDGVFMLLVAMSAGGVQDSPDPLLGCFKAVMEVLGEAAAASLLEEVLSRAQAAPNPEASSGMMQRLHRMLVQAWLAELQPLMRQRWAMTNRLQALVTQPLQLLRQQPAQPMPYNEQWALSQNALLAAQAATAAAAGQWQVLLQLVEQLAGLHEANASAVSYLLEQGGRAPGVVGFCLALLKAWRAVQQQVSSRKEGELKEAVVGAVQAARLRQVPRDQW
jgi:hypothetical protein